MITAEDILRPVTPMHAWEIPGQTQKRPSPHHGLRSRIARTLTDTPEHASTIANRIGVDVVRVNQELSKMARAGFAYRVGGGFYRSIKT